MRRFKALKSLNCQLYFLRYVHELLEGLDPKDLEIILHIISHISLGYNISVFAIYFHDLEERSNFLNFDLLAYINDIWKDQKAGTNVLHFVKQLR